MDSVKQCLKLIICTNCVAWSFACSYGREAMMKTSTRPFSGCLQTVLIVLANTLQNKDPIRLMSMFLVRLSIKENHNRWFLSLNVLS